MPMHKIETLNRRADEYDNWFDVNKYGSKCFVRLWIN